TEPQKTMLLKVAATVTGGLLMVVFIGVLRQMETTAVINPESTGSVGMVKNLGKLLLSDCLLPFDAASMLLPTALVGAVMLGKTHRKKKVTGMEQTGQPKTPSQQIEATVNE